MKIKKIKKTIIDLPSPSNISIWWNFGSLLGMCLSIQLITGIFLTMHYCPDTLLAYESMVNIHRNVNMGWLMRTIHSNGASMFFICMYLHISRGLYYGSFNLYKTWTIGMLIFLLTMMTAFLGYVLPWGQMSFWGATVITNFLSTIPYLGTTIVEWIWGGFNINNSTLTRFYSFHFILPFMVTLFTLLHIMSLHTTGSNNPLGTNSNTNKIPFHPFFTYKDLMSVTITLMMFSFIVLIKPYILSDPDNFTPANTMSTPPHIQPEWYFLFAYTILRSIPNKLGGVLALIMSILVFMFIPLIKKNMQSNQFYPLNKILMWILMYTMLMLTWLGSKPMEEPYIKYNQLYTLMYFSFIPMSLINYKMWDNIIFKN